MKKSILLTGSNIGNREKYLMRAIEFLANDVGVISKCSSIYESEPWGFNADEKFLNQAIELNTNLQAEDLLKKVLEIEYNIGRRRKMFKGYASREIDIDIIFYDNEVIDEETLKIPHPYFEVRRFALIPVADISPFFIHPKLKKNVKQLLLECDDNSKIILYRSNKMKNIYLFKNI